MNTQDHQQSLIDAIFAASVESEAFDRAGLEIYRRNLSAGAHRSLSISYPTVTLLIGSDLMRIFAGQFVRQLGRDKFDWADWGSRFPNWLKSHPISEEHPYLPDVAVLDWAIHKADRAADAAVNRDRWALVAQADPHEVQLKFAPGALVVRSRFPIIDIFNAHEDNPDAPDFSAVKLKLQLGLGQNAIVWRRGFATRVRELGSGERHWLTLLNFPGTNLGRVIDQPPLNAMPLDEWLPQAVEEELVIGAELAQSKCE